MIIKNYEEDKELFLKYLYNYINKRNINVFLKLLFILKKRILLRMYETYRLKDKYGFIHIWSILIYKMFKFFNEITSTRKINLSNNLDGSLAYCFQLIDKYIEEKSDLESDTLIITEYTLLRLQEEKSLSPLIAREIQELFDIGDEFMGLIFSYALSLLADFMADTSGNYLHKFYKRNVKEFSPIIKKIIKSMEDEVGIESVLNLLLKFSEMTITFPKFPIKEFIEFESDGDVNLDYLI